MARVPSPTQVSITVRLGKTNGKANGNEVAERLHELFQNKPGETDVRLRLLRSKDFLVSYDLAVRVQADREFIRAIEDICGAGSLEVVHA